MRLIFGILLFCFFFILGGLGVHFLLYDRLGLFIWSINEGSIAQTKVEVSGRPLKRQPQSEPQKAVITDDSARPKDSISGSATAEPSKDPNVIALFDGKTLGNWQITQFGGEGDVTVDNGNLEFAYGEVMTGVNWQNDPPRTSNYEISLDAMRLDGSDFFCALTFPVKDSHASLIVGGWGGTVVGISSIDGLDASENETLKIEKFETNVWYKIRVKVTDDEIQVWINDEQKVDVVITDREISLRPGTIEISVPIGIASFQSSAKYRNIIWKNLSE